MILVKVLPTRKIIVMYFTRNSSLKAKIILEQEGSKEWKIKINPSYFVTEEENWMESQERKPRTKEELLNYVGFFAQMVKKITK